MNLILIITIIVLVSGFLLYFIVKEIIKTYKNRPYNQDEMDKLEGKDKLI